MWLMLQLCISPKTAYASVQLQPTEHPADSPRRPRRTGDVLSSAECNPGCQDHQASNSSPAQLQLIKRSAHLLRSQAGPTSNAEACCRYRHTSYQKQTKNQWARDDPAFLIVLCGLLAVAASAFCITCALFPSSVHSHLHQKSA